MVYLTTPFSPRFRQMTLEELVFGTYAGNRCLTSGKGNTTTVAIDRETLRMQQSVDIVALVNRLEEFNRVTAHLHDVPAEQLYHTFYIPKKKGGLRRIDAPQPELMNALRTLKSIFENDFKALHHTGAFAYVKGRSTIDAVKRHQQNESRWFAKFDLTNFFGSTTLDFVLSQLSMIFPFSMLMRNPHGRRQLELALSLGFLNGGLPQGTPLSPTLTNIIMIPIDYTLSKTLRDFEKQRFIYTRYADDFIISSRYDFDYHKVEALIESTLSSFHAPFSLNRTKTRYGSSAGSNWNLGVMLNKDNQITIGRQNKRQFESMLVSFIRDQRAGIAWDPHDIQTTLGYYNYYQMVEPEAIPAIVAHINQKQGGVDVIRMLKDSL